MEISHRSAMAVRSTENSRMSGTAQVWSVPVYGVNAGGRGPTPTWTDRDVVWPGPGASWLPARARRQSEARCPMSKWFSVRTIVHRRAAGAFEERDTLRRPAAPAEGADARPVPRRLLRHRPRAAALDMTRGADVPRLTFTLD